MLVQILLKMWISFGFLVCMHGSSSAVAEMDGNHHYQFQSEWDWVLSFPHERHPGLFSSLHLPFREFLFPWVINKMLIFLLLNGRFTQPFRWWKYVYQEPRLTWGEDFPFLLFEPILPFGLLHAEAATHAFYWQFLDVVSSTVFS